MIACTGSIQQSITDLGGAYQGLDLLAKILFTDGFLRRTVITLTCEPTAETSASNGQIQIHGNTDGTG